jgi:hypothetical protein
MLGGFFVQAQTVYYARQKCEAELITSSVYKKFIISITGPPLMNSRILCVKINCVHPAV